ncbi:MAG: hypothetical protein M3004_04095 [Bacteroidota bacterium]|nr:hypothetical protein [Bacteroidota bacterium]
MRKVLQFFCLMLLIFTSGISFSQISPPPTTDTFRTIQIIHADVYRQKPIDSITKVDILAGHVNLLEGTTKFTCDSAIINKKLNTVEAFGNVHINQADSIFTSSQYLKYIGNDRMAYLKKNVKLADKKGGTLLTQELEYDLKTGIGKYINGGKVINGKTILTSKEGTYYADTKDVMFKYKVDMADPKYKIKADSLLYNMQFEKATFIGPTVVTTKEATIFTTNGTYDLKTGNAFFGSRTLVKDSSGRTYQALNMAVDEKSGISQLEGNAVVKDSANSFILTGNEIYFSKKNNSMLATKKPVMIFWQKKDTTYVAGDTLFSGFTKRVFVQDIIPNKDSIARSIGNDSAKKNLAKVDSSEFEKLHKTKKITTNKTDTSIRYFIAYHHVKIFNDSLQSVCDSLFYSAADSIFRLFHEPVMWSGNSQVTGDTIFLYTKNKKAERVYVFNNGMIANKINESFYNQISGRTINGYFTNGVIDYIRAKGSPAESIYYLQDKDSAFTGMNRADGSVIEMYFVKQELNKGKLENDVHGKLYPMRQIPKDQKYLKNFIWLDKRRPKNKLELFE